MKCAPFPLLAFFVIASTYGKEPAPTVTFVSPCECIAFHGVNRWAKKKCERSNATFYGERLGKPSHCLDY